MTIDSKNIHYRELNERIRLAAANGSELIRLENMAGQRYVGCGLRGKLRIEISGIPGNDLAAFMDGPAIHVSGDAQDAVGNTMNGGKVVIRGSAGDVLGYAMRGGRIYVGGNVGYRVGINMKSYQDKIPVIVAGGTAGDFLGEYMAGGTIVILGGNGRTDQTPVGYHVGTGMHGGTIYIRGRVSEAQLGKEAGVSSLTEQDRETMYDILSDYCAELSLDLQRTLRPPFAKICPRSHRPYGQIYAY